MAISYTWDVNTVDTYPTKEYSTIATMAGNFKQNIGKFPRSKDQCHHA